MAGESQPRHSQASAINPAPMVDFPDSIT